MSGRDNSLNDALDIARYIVMPSLLIVLGHAFNYWALDLIFLAISFILIKFFWREYVEFSNRKPRRITLGAKKAHYILSIYCLVATIVLIYFGEEIGEYISLDPNKLMIGHFLLIYLLSGTVYWYLFNTQEE
jgi:hypothetical protein